MSTTLTRGHAAAQDTPAPQPGASVVTRHGRGSTAVVTRHGRVVAAVATPTTPGSAEPDLIAEAEQLKAQALQEADGYAAERARIAGQLAALQRRIETLATARAEIDREAAQLIQALDDNQTLVSVAGVEPMDMSLESARLAALQEQGAQRGAEHEKLSAAHDTLSAQEAALAAQESAARIRAEEALATAIRAERQWHLAHIMRARAAWLAAIRDAGSFNLRAGLMRPTETTAATDLYALDRHKDGLMAGEQMVDTLLHRWEYDHLDTAWIERLAQQWAAPADTN